MDEYLNGGLDTIDPEVRAHVYSLVTALGGSSASEDGRYQLGDDALGCLKDIKRWLKLHDEKLNRLDVTRCLAEAHLVKGDLLEILGQWPEEAMNEQWRGRVGLACVELLVPLTWPVEKDLMSEVTRNQHRHLPYIQLAQITYKREVLEHPSGDVLKKAIRLALPSMAVPSNERTSRDEGILKLVLYFIRNMAMISAPTNLPVEWNEQEVSRSATIKAFEQQNVFPVLLTIASNLSSNFKTQDVVILEVLFHLIKGIDPKKLFMSKPERSVAASGELRDLMSKESDLLKNFKKNAPTRHNRFGTMVWIERNEHKMSTISGQDVLRDGQQTLDKMDSSKKWNKPKRRPVIEKNHMNFDLPEALTHEATEALRGFVEDFLDSSFNPLFTSLRKAIEREADRVLLAHSQQFWYLISWFLRAESERRKAKKQLHEQKKGKDVPLELDSFGVVAGVLNQETFILLNRYMQSNLDNKEWLELDAGMRCFTQILLTIQEMAESPLDEDQEIADNIQNNIFYEETTHDRVLSILRGYKDQNFSYLDAATELAHVFLRMLERYSKENGDLQIRSRRKARRKKKDEKQQASNQDEDEDANAGSEAEDEAQASRISSERKFDFNRFASKFVTQQSVNTFFKFISFYKDLSTEQLKRAHRFFYRVAFKQELTVLLFRVDIIQLFNRMIKSPQSLHRSNPMFGEWTELVKQVFRRLVKKMKQRPELAVELLFSKIPATTYYLEYGYEKQTVTTTPRAPAELEVRGGLPKDDQIGVVVAALIGEEKEDLVGWVSKTLQSAAGERLSWEGLDAARAAEAEVRPQVEEQSGQSSDPPNTTSAETQDQATVPAATSSPASEAPPIRIQPDSTARKLAMFKDSKLRLLLKLVGAERQGFKDDIDAAWMLPSALTSTVLFDLASTIDQHKDSPRMTYGELEDDPIPAAQMLKRVPAVRALRNNAVSGGMFGPEDDEGLDGFLDDGEEPLFPAGGPTARKSDVLEELKAKRRSRKKKTDDSDGDDNEIDPEVLEQRRLARQMRELERRRKIKSTEFVHASDEESDEERDLEFFQRERETASKRAAAYDEAFEAEKRKMLNGEAGKSGNKRKRGTEDRGGKAKKLRSSDDEGEGEGVGQDSASEASMSTDAETDDEALFVSNRENSSSKRKARATRTKKSSTQTEEDHPSSSDVDVDLDRNGDRNPASDIDLDDDLNDDLNETPLSSQSEPRVEKLALAETDGNRRQSNTGVVSGSAKAAELVSGGGGGGRVDNEEDDGEDEDDDEDTFMGSGGVPVSTNRRRARMAVLDDSDDE